MQKISHPFHLVNPSPWPFLTGISAVNTVIALVSYMHRVAGSFFFLLVAISTIGFVLFFWWRDVIREATFDGQHTFTVQQNLKFGVVLFIVSEVMFFFGFFWAYFHSSLSPAIQIGAVWPPLGIIALDPFSVPLLNTFILLTSGVTLTICHHAVLHNRYIIARNAIIATLVYAVIFTVEQVFEYLHAPFNINDSIYGTTFYLLTGFHGFHVIIGTIFIFVCFVRLLYTHFTSSHHVGLESAIWYWHFVDVVWLFLYIFIYVHNFL